MEIIECEKNVVGQCDAMSYVISMKTDFNNFHDFDDNFLLPFQSIHLRFP